MPAGSAGIMAASYGMEAILGPIATEESTTPEEPVFTPVVYNFESFDSTGTIKYGEGTVQTTGNTSDGRTEVEVLTNISTDPNAIDFVGLNFWINSNALVNSNTLYVLYDSEGNNTGIKVKVTQ
jgi:ABC-type phosphate transport system substrate-binding protein